MQKFNEIQWHVFDKHCTHPTVDGNVLINPIQQRTWLESLESCSGALLGAGFEGPSEALFLGKPLMVVPMSNQYEQKCNASALHELGVRTSSPNRQKLESSIKNWLGNLKSIRIDIPELYDELLRDVFRSHSKAVLSI